MKSSIGLLESEPQVDRPGWNWVLVWAAYLVISLFMSLPVVLDIGQNLGAKGDNLLNAWILWRINENLITRPWALFEGNIFYPYQLVMSYSETMLSGALMVLPAHILGASPITQYNLLKILAFSLNGLGMYALATRATGSRLAGFMGGLIFAFALPRYNLNLQMHCSQFIPFVFWAWLRFVDRPGPGRAWVLGVFTLLAMLSNGHYALFIAYALVFWALFDFIRTKGRGWFRIIVQLALPALVCGLAALGLFWPYLDKPARIFAEVVHFSNDFSDLFRAHHGSWLYSIWVKPSGANQWFFGLIPWLLALGSIIWLAFGKASNRVRYLLPALLMTILAAWASLGPYAWLYEMIWEYLPGFKGLRAVNRLAMMSLVGVSLLAAHGFYLLIRRRPKSAPLILGLVCVLFLAEAVSIPAQKKFLKIPADSGQRFAWLAERPKVKNILYLPMKYEEVDITYASRLHGKRMINGYSGYFPALHQWFQKHQELFPDPQYIKALQAFEVDHLVLEQKLFKAKHDAILRNPELEVEEQNQGLALIRVRPRKVDLDRKAVLAGRVDLLWGVNQEYFQRFDMSMRAQPKQKGPLVYADVELHNKSESWLPDGVLQFWLRVDGASEFRESLVNLPRLKPGQNLHMKVGAMLPWPQEQEVRFRIDLRIENKMHSKEISTQAKLGPSRTVEVLKVAANPMGYEAGKMVDRDIHSRWTTNQVFKPGEYVELELGSDDPKYVYLLNYDKSMRDHAKGLEIYTSPDGTEWKKLVRVEPLPVEDYTGMEAVRLDLAGIKARHIRLKPTHHNPHHWWSLHEIVVIQ